MYHNVIGLHAQNIDTIWCDHVKREHLLFEILYLFHINFNSWQLNWQSDDAETEDVWTCCIQQIHSSLNSKRKCFKAYCITFLFHRISGLLTMIFTTLDRFCNLFLGIYSSINNEARWHAHLSTVRLSTLSSSPRHINNLVVSGRPGYP